MYELGKKLRARKFGDWALVLEQLMNAPFDDDDCGAMPPHLFSLANTPKLGVSWSITCTESTPNSPPSPLSHGIYGEIFMVVQRGMKSR